MSDGPAHDPSHPATAAPDARDDWERRSAVRTSAGDSAGVPRPPAPTGLHARPGRHQVTLTWDPVPGAIGYQVHVAASADGALTPLDHHGGDVLAVPGPPYADTTGPPGVTRWYAVSALADIAVAGPPSDRAAAAMDATPGNAPSGTGTSDTAPGVTGTGDGDVQRRGAAGQPGDVQVTVDAAGDAGALQRPWRPLIGAEHLSLALSTEQVGGRPIGPELSQALADAHAELGVRAVRAHGILCDDLGVYREVGGRPVHDFSGVDRVYDHVRALGLRPCVELSFMPRDLASDPSATVFAYGAIVSPPRDWDRWADLVRALVAHLVERHGLAEVRDHWSFEVWNEANLEVFWSGTPEQFWRLYDVTAAAVKDVHPDLRVGGPATAAVGWIEQLLAHADRRGTAVDFVSTHAYGTPPLDLTPALARHGRTRTPVWWTEWGVSPTHFHDVNDTVFAGAFLLRGMAAAMGHSEALSYWVVSDHFEELGRPPGLLHGGFGLRTVGGLRKPRWWALWMLQRLGDARLPVDVAGDGAGSLVEALAARRDDGGVAALLWNLTLDQQRRHGHAPLDRAVRLAIGGLEPGRAYRMTRRGVEPGRSDVATTWQQLRRPGQQWPDDAQWDALHAADRLEALAPPQDVTADQHGRVELACHLPMPGMHLVELTAT